MTPHARALEAHRDAFGDRPVCAWRAPGRVNLIGEHVDYSEGLVCPMAIDRETVAVASARDDRRVQIVSAERGGGAAFSLDGGGAARGAWSDYAEGVARALRDAGVPLRGADVAVASSVPIGAGLSSSAALELAAGAALLDLAGVALDRRALARAARTAENAFVGVRSGIMDQLVCALGLPGHALTIDCRTEAATPVPLPRAAAIVVADSGVRHALASSGYNERRAESEAAAALLGVPLRDASLADLKRLAHEPVLQRRARHVVTENARVLAFADALAAGDLAAAGRAMTESHRSLRDDYEVSIPELDGLVARALELPGVYGARMTGGGFGGSIVVLAAPAAIDDLVGSLGERAAAVSAVRATEGVSKIF